MLTDEPYRAGKESQLFWEMLRVLLLSSTIGMLGRECHIKVMIAELLSLVFFAFFLIKPVKLTSFL